MTDKPYWNHEVETRSVEEQRAKDTSAIRMQLDYVSLLSGYKYMNSNNN